MHCINPAPIAQGGIMLRLPKGESYPASSFSFSSCSNRFASVSSFMVTALQGHKQVVRSPQTGNGAMQLETLDD